MRLRCMQMRPQAVTRTSRSWKGYRYYVSPALLGAGKENSPSQCRVNAHGIERVVVDSTATAMTQLAADSTLGAYEHTHAPLSVIGIFK